MEDQPCLWESAAEEPTAPGARELLRSDRRLRSPQWPRGLAFSVALLGAAGLAALATARPWRWAARPRGAAPEAAVAEAEEKLVARIRVDSEDFCGEISEDVEFHTRGSIYWVRNIGNQEMCCAECDAHPQCHAWVYGKQKGVEGLSGHCYLKKLEEGEEPQRVKRAGVVSGLLSRSLQKHGIVAGLLANELGPKNGSGGAILANETCPGLLNLAGYGEVRVVAAMWHEPEEEAARVEVPDAHWALVPHLGSRAYFASNCTPGAYDKDLYTSLKLLGGSIRYTIDLSNAGCGCNTKFYLVPMKYNEYKSRCEDYRCGHGTDGCGVPCAEIGIQDANMYAWASSLHLKDDAEGPSRGYGGGDGWIGRRDWTDREYGPGAICIDTTWPFEVEVAFPVGDSGDLRAMQVTLTQEGHSCPLRLSIDRYSYGGKDGLEELSAVLAAGVTPALGYSGSAGLQWLDGQGTDAHGPCVRDAPEACAASVRFYNFAVEEGSSKRASVNLPAAPQKESPLNVAMNAVHRHAASRERKAELAEVTHEKKALDMEKPCGTNCDVPSAEAFTREGDGEKKVVKKAKIGQEEEDEDTSEEESTPVHNMGPYDEKEENNVEWEIVASRLKIRSDNSSESDIIKEKVQGEMLYGKRIGTWVQLSHNLGYAPIKEGDVIFLRERIVSYRKTVSGSCADIGMFPINDFGICERAGFALGYFDTTVQAFKGNAKRPEGCYMKHGELWLATHKANVGNGVGGGGVPICSSKAYKSTTTTTTTTSTTTGTTTTTTHTTTVTTTSTTTWGWPSLFCVEVVRVHGYELPLVKEQQKHSASIFSCDEYAIFSDGGESKVVGIGPDGLEIKTIVIPPIKEAIGDLNHGATTNSWLNTETFLQVWDLAKKDGRFVHHDWTVKVDPDAVFFPDRLRKHMKSHTYPHAKLFVMNCARYNPVALYGSVEIFSKEALHAYLTNQQKCRKNLPWHGWGEDFFMSHCMDLLGVGRIYDFDLLADKRCVYRPCTDTSRVVYHDYKDASPDGSWFKCWRQSGGGL